MSTNSKRPYETPSVNVIGSFEEVTQGTSTGNHLDAVIPNNIIGASVPTLIGFINTHQQTTS